MDCFDHERRDDSFGHGRGHGMNYDIPWDGYE